MKKILILTLLALIMAHCGKNKDLSTSKISVFGGEIIDSAKYPAVVQIKNGNGLCTATFVAPDTLITAAHCALTQKARISGANDVLANVEVILKQDAAVKSKQVFTHPQSRFSETGRANYQTSSVDVAIIILEDYKSPHMAKISNKAPEMRDGVTMIGFGLPYRDKKQIGFNEVSQVAPGLIFSVLDQDSDELRAAVLGAGDSGGPLFIKNKLAGIASSGSRVLSLHTDLTSKSVSEFLHRHLNETLFE